MTNKELFGSNETYSVNADKVKAKQLKELQRKYQYHFKRASKAKANQDRYTLDWSPLYTEVYYSTYEARVRTGGLAELHFGKAINCYKNGEHYWTTKMHYRWDDPVWKAEAASPELFGAIIGQALHDATLGRTTWVNGANDCRFTAAEQQPALAYFETDNFKHDCSVTGVEPDYITRKIKEAIDG